MKKSDVLKWFSITSAICSIALGWVFYLSVREYDPTGLLHHSLLKSFRFTGHFPDLLQSAPTFFHALCLTFLYSLVCVRRRSFWLLWLGSTFGYELAQLFSSSLGTFDPLDLLSIAAASPVAFMIVQHLKENNRKNIGWLAQRNQFFALSFAVATSVASSGPPVSRPISHLPICMSKEEFRSAFLVSEPKPMTTSGKIYLHGTLLLVSEPFAGIHVFDNTNPAAPVAVAFITIPGNTDIAMKNNLLYADSAIDLLTIKFEGNNAGLVNRQENVFFPRTPADFSTEDVYVPEHKLEECSASGGVVVGFTERADGSAYEKRISENKK
jgi:hypothetical protein